MEGVFINICVGLIYEIIIKRDIRNNTYLNDFDFINDKDNIIKLLSNRIDTTMFNIIYYDNYIKLVLRKSYFYKYIDSIFDCFYNHKLFDFKYSDNTGIYNYNNSFDDYLFYDIDRDYNSIYSPISIDTKVINLFECFYDSSNYNNTFNLLDSYSREFISNNISLLLIYGFLDK